MGAADRLRLYSPGMDLKTAYWFMYDLRKNYSTAISGEMPASIKRHIPKAGERYSITLAKQKLEDNVENRIRQDYEKPEDQEGVRKALFLYGVDDNAMEIERVRMCILRRSLGNPLLMLDLLQIAKIDYRDILQGGD
jgi:hypothetical protein